MLDTSVTKGINDQMSEIPKYPRNPVPSQENSLLIPRLTAQERPTRFWRQDRVSVLIPILNSNITCRYEYNLIYVERTNGGNLV